MLSDRFRRALADREGGAVAVVVAITSLVLFGAGALTVDIGQMYARRRSAQKAADLAALAGAAALPNVTNARTLAYNYLVDNYPDWDATPGPITDYDDDDPANGEIDFALGNTQIRVVAPRTTVNFGLAAALGKSSATVNAAATAQIFSPAPLVPLLVADATPNGYLCVKDTSPGLGGSPAALREALLAAPPVPGLPVVTSISPITGSTAGGTAFTITGSNLKDTTQVSFGTTPASNFVAAANGKSIDGTAPAHAAGPVLVTVETPSGSAFTAFTFVVPPPSPAPTVTGISPTSGTSAGGTTVTITGTDFTGATAVTFGTTPATFTVDSATQITATSPPGTGVVDVRVITTGGTSPVTTADEFTYIEDGCAGTTGSFGFLDIPRADTVGANATLISNLIKGIDHSIESFPPALLPAQDTPCKSGATTIPGAVLDTGVDGANCLDIENGNKINYAGQAYLDGVVMPSLDPKLEDPPSGHDTGTLGGRPDMDVDRLSDYLSVPVATFLAALSSGATPTAGWLSSDILLCPRFAIVPELHVSGNPPNGYYPITGFRGMFIDGSAPDYGFTFNSAGSQVSSVKAYVFDLGYLPGVVSASSTTGTTTYIGSGPVVPALVHDADDPAY